MIIDFHTHIFPRNICDEREKCFSQEPTFEALYRSPKARLVSADRLIQAMDESGVDRSVVFGFPWKNETRCKKHNDYIVDMVNQHPDRLTGLVCFDLALKDAASETRRCLRAGLAGVGELAFYGSGIEVTDLAPLAPIMQLCREADAPILIHTNEPVGHLYPGKTPNTLAQIYRLVQRFPQNKIVLAHWGGGLFFYHIMKKEVKAALSRVYFDTAASPFLYDSGVYRIAIDILGPEKILFGSDYPLIDCRRYFAEMEQAGLNAEERDLICGGNAEKLLRIGK